MSPLAGEADNKGFLGEILFARQKNRLFIGPTPSDPYEFWTRIVVQKACELPQRKLPNY